MNGEITVDMNLELEAVYDQVMSENYSTLVEVLCRILTVFPNHPHIMQSHMLMILLFELEFRDIQFEWVVQ